MKTNSSLCSDIDWPPAFVREMITMDTPQILRPYFPAGYVENAKRLLPWSHVEERLTEAKNYWLCTVWPDGRPHTVPKWGVWRNGLFYFDGSPQTHHARNIAANPRVAIHLESGDSVVIVNGAARELPKKPTVKLATALAQAYTRKYKEFGYAPQPTMWDAGGLFAVTPHTALAWTAFTEDPTKFVLA